MFDQFQLYWMNLFINIHGLVRERQIISFPAETNEAPSGLVLHAGKTHGYVHQFRKDQIHKNIARCHCRSDLSCVYPFYSHVGLLSTEIRDDHFFTVQ